MKKAIFSLILIITLMISAQALDKKGINSLKTLEFDQSWTLTTTDKTPLLDIRYGFISAPKDGTDINEWRKELEGYRRMILDGALQPRAEMSYDGMRSWARLDGGLAKLYLLQPGDKLRARVAAKWLEGGNELCVAFDTLTPSYVKTGWTGVVGTIPVPKDGKWHEVETTVTVPDFDLTGNWLRPIIGMDATYNPEPAKMLIGSVQFELDDPKRMWIIGDKSEKLSQTHPLDTSIYKRKDFEWLRRSYTCHFTFMYDSSFYDPVSGDYKLDPFLKDGKDQFGGYDILLLWQGYPRLGADERNQFDMYRDMPGGLDGLRKLVDEAHARGIKVFIDYNPWDTGTRREPESDQDALVDLVKTTDCDGIFLDTMFGTSSEFRRKMDQAKPGVVFAPEGYPSVEQLPVSPSSWGQYPYVCFTADNPKTGTTAPDLLHHKWIEPRHMIHQICRWNLNHQNEIETAFFNGSGMVVWENVFGTYNPWKTEDRITWRKCSTILRYFTDVFSTEEREPYYETVVDRLYANRWTLGSTTIYTLLNRSGKSISDSMLLEVPKREGKEYFDLWSGLPLKSEISGKTVRLFGSIDRIGCILETDKKRIGESLHQMLEKVRKEAESPRGGDEERVQKSLFDAHPVARTPENSRDNPPEGMVLVPGKDVRMKLEHTRRETGCYPDPGTPTEKIRYFTEGLYFQDKVQHDIGPQKVRSFFIDKAEVTNAEFKRFIDVTGYKPKHPENFLKHWKNGKMPEELADYPVVYVDLDDARAYAAWTGKRLPTEEEWHLAAQGTDGRTWPWGNEFDAEMCNTTGHMVPAASYPNGVSPYGCYNMTGNVWEWTESCRDDGHTRFVILRGGSYMNATGSIWYIEGGPRPCTSHTKFILMWPGLDRCSTIGFRCVKDVSGE